MPTYTALGWRWANVNRSGMAHLVPSRPGQFSRTACNKVSLKGVQIVEPLLTVPHCKRCEDADA